MPLVDVGRSHIETRMGFIDFQERATKPLRLDQYGVCTALFFRAQFTITNGGVAPVTAKPFALARLFKRIDLAINGQDIIQTIDGPGLVARSILEYGVRPYGMDTAVNMGAGAATTYEIVLPLSQVLPRAIGPRDAALDFRKINQALINVTWGDINDIYVTPNAAAISAVTCEVVGEFLAYPKETDTFMLRDIASFEHQVNGANSDFAPYPIDRGGYWLRSFNMMTDSNDVLVDTIINNVILKGGNFVFHDRARVFFRADQAHKYQLPVAERQAGLYRVECTLLGSNQTLIYMGNPSSPDLFLRFNVAHPGATDYIRISREGLRDY